MKDFLEEDQVSIRDLMVLRLAKKTKSRAPYTGSIYNSPESNGQAKRAENTSHPAPVIRQSSSVFNKCTKQFLFGKMSPAKPFSQRHVQNISLPPPHNVGRQQHPLVPTPEELTPHSKVVKSLEWNRLLKSDELVPINHSKFPSKGSSSHVDPTRHRRRLDTVQREVNPEMVLWLEDHLKWGALPPRFISSPNPKLPSPDYSDSNTKQRHSCVRDQPTTSICCLNQKNEHALWNMSGIQPPASQLTHQWPCHHCGVYSPQYPLCGSSHPRKRYRHDRNTHICPCNSDGSSMHACSRDETKNTRMNTCHADGRNGESCCNLGFKYGDSKLLCQTNISDGHRISTSHSLHDWLLGSDSSSTHPDPRTSSPSVHLSNADKSINTSPKLEGVNTYSKPEYVNNTYSKPEIRTQYSKSESSIFRKKKLTNAFEHEPEYDPEEPRPVSRIPLPPPGLSAIRTTSDTSLDGMAAGSKSDQGLYDVNWDFTDKDTLLDRIKTRLSRISHWD